MSQKPSQASIPEVSSLSEEDIAALLDVPPKEMAGATAIMETVRALQAAYENARKKFKLNQRKIADKLQVGRQIIHRRLLGQENMTIRTLAEMAWAMGYKLRIVFEDDPTQQAHAGNWFQIGPAAQSAANTRVNFSAQEALSLASQQSAPNNWKAN